MLPQGRHNHQTMTVQPLLPQRRQLRVLLRKLLPIHVKASEINPLPKSSRNTIIFTRQSPQKIYRTEFLGTKIACQSWACFRSVRSYNRVFALSGHRTLASIFIFFTNFFLITVSNRFCALLSIRAALLIGSRCVVVFAIFFL